ncbi:hypothetical protein C0Q70_21529 [Pomacea canaliculata]|uniref:THD domain-containing protein n=1 Tax=Pomacea canaliculata TaxID=400727 RepID=A0A2T7NCS0_POMCA|nr:hypothetical protein C0Q70_21529 [Pomacea canaliculata]
MHSVLKNTHNNKIKVPQTEVYELKETLTIDAMREKRLRQVKSSMLEIRKDSSMVDRRPAAHLGVSPTINTNSLNDNLALRILWDTSRSPSFITGDLVFKQDRVVVKTPGYYFIYAGLQFMMDPAIVSSSTIVTYVYRDKNDTEVNRKKLMTSRISSCKDWREGQAGPTSTYLAGAFLLHEDDEISVLTTSQSMLQRLPATTYFGIHLI